VPRRYTKQQQLQRRKNSWLLGKKENKMFFNQLEEKEKKTNKHSSMQITETERETQRERERFEPKKRS
jgi:hypothetical protein